MAGKTLFDKIWEKHHIKSIDADTNLLFIDLHLVHEVTSPQAFDSLRINNRVVKYPELTLATVDHGIPTSNRALGIKDPLSKKQIEALENNCDEFGVTLFGVNDPRQGIVHVIGPEQGITQPGMTIVCGDSHTATHGAFGSLAFGIGTSEVEHVLATQTLAMSKPKTMKVEVTGELQNGITPKDLILGIIRKIGTGGGAGHVIEYVPPVLISNCQNCAFGSVPTAGIFENATVQFPPAIILNTLACPILHVAVAAAVIVPRSRNAEGML